MNRISLTTLPGNTKLSLYGLGVGILGLVIQWIADPDKFPGFPPGILVIAVFGLLVVLGARWFWTPLLATLVAVFIMIGGLLGGDLLDNLRSGDLGTIAGNIVLYIGLVIAAIAGVLATVDARRATSRTDRC
ncbi:hypothetical protein DFR70_106249 [Nocardia tenerifensis]|uniref:Uncharacterized protein n=1 Tax=Nocardia tenerifensis TaxID=228006 RepID=A0A318KCG9_9NOCA|nr:hypothetical protein [Nocardia tenerifensis]PXX63191.1 hypothetical protein DFR70_106249 [Nocardia tenerifensis]